MNIAQAKEEIAAALDSYHRRDENGMYVYPLVRQRPILLMGPPGIGKTAIMEQIAREKHVGLVSYTMTHHTRQSAIGLPQILIREYDGEKVSVTEYTLSEIIASVYDCMERTGCQEGILFIDEINCVSETLAPVMLEFLQNKMFGSHRVPDGWMIVAAGNPPEYNKSVREFDIVTLDRVRRIDVEADEKSWADYASAAGVHGAILSWLEMKPENFYLVSLEEGEKHFVTARGWEDLSWFLRSSEMDGRPVTKEQIGEFLQDSVSAAEFYTYYQIWQRHGEDYEVPRLLDGSLTGPEREAKVQMAAKAPLEEQITVTEQMLDHLGTHCASWQETGQWLTMLGDEAVKLRELEKKAKPDGRSRSENEFSKEEAMAQDNAVMKNTDTALARYIRRREDTLRVQRRNELITLPQERLTRKTISLLRNVDEKSREEGQVSSGQVRGILNERIREIQTGQARTARQIRQMIRNAMIFCKEAYEGDAQMRLLIFGMARATPVSAFLMQYPDEMYIRESSRFMDG